MPVKYRQPKVNYGIIGQVIGDVLERHGEAIDTGIERLQRDRSQQFGMLMPMINVAKNVNTPEAWESIRKAINNPDIDSEVRSNLSPIVDIGYDVSKKRRDIYESLDAITGELSKKKYETVSDAKSAIDLIELTSRNIDRASESAVSLQEAQALKGSLGRYYNEARAWNEMYGYDVSPEKGVQLGEFDEDTKEQGKMLEGAFNALQSGDIETTFKILGDLQAVDVSNLKTSASRKLKEQEDSITNWKNNTIANIRMQTKAHNANVSDKLSEATGSALSMPSPDSDKFTLDAVAVMTKENEDWISNAYDWYKTTYFPDRPDESTFKTRESFIKNFRKLVESDDKLPAGDRDAIIWAIERRKTLINASNEFIKGVSGGGMGLSPKDLGVIGAETEPTKKKGEGTLSSVINTYAPPSENDTDKYVKSVADSLGVSPDAPTSELDPDKLADAIVIQEGGNKEGTRAVRNNNPGNLRPGTLENAKKLYGDSVTGVDDGGFAVFKTREDGYEALREWTHKAVGKELPRVAQEGPEYDFAKSEFDTAKIESMGGGIDAMYKNGLIPDIKKYLPALTPVATPKLVRKAINMEVRDLKKQLKFANKNNLSGLAKAIKVKMKIVKAFYSKKGIEKLTGWERSIPDPSKRFIIEMPLETPKTRTEPAYKRTAIGKTKNIPLE